MNPPYRIVLLRHGESTWNLENRFTGWTDVGLTDKGAHEAHHAGQLLRAEGFVFDLLHTSLLKRAIVTAQTVVDELDQTWLPVERYWRLNERHYGALQGLDKKQTAAKYGDAQVFQWRRSYDIPPPVLDATDERHPSRDPRYASLAPDLLPACESLKDVVARLLPWWYDNLVPALRGGKRVLVVAHGNSIRALIKHLDHVSEDAITELNIPTGIPLVYDLDDQMKALGHRYLGDAEAAHKAAEAVAKQATRA